jgi:hypothetical protein
VAPCFLGGYAIPSNRYTENGRFGLLEATTMIRKAAGGARIGLLVPTAAGAVGAVFLWALALWFSISYWRARGAL